MTENGMHAGEERLPAEIANHMRMLVHDVANALETIVMTHYLLGTSEQSSQAREWLAMMETGIKKASLLNKQLGEYIHENS